MNDSILNSVKLQLGILPEYTVFDQQLILAINTAFSILHQLGVGPKDGYAIYAGISTRVIFPRILFVRCVSTVRLISHALTATAMSSKTSPRRKLKRRQDLLMKNGSAACAGMFMKVRCPRTLSVRYAVSVQISSISSNEISGAIIGQY